MGMKEDIGTPSKVMWVPVGRKRQKSQLRAKHGCAPPFVLLQFVRFQALLRDGTGPSPKVSVLETEHSGSLDARGDGRFALVTRGRFSKLRELSSRMTVRQHPAMPRAADWRAE